MNLTDCKTSYKNEKTNLTILDNTCIELFNELDVLGIYTYSRMILSSQSTTIENIVDKLVEKFKVDKEFAIFVLGRLKHHGLLK